MSLSGLIILLVLLLLSPNICLAVPSIEVGLIGDSMTDQTCCCDGCTDIYPVYTQQKLDACHPGMFQVTEFADWGRSILRDSGCYYRPYWNSPEHIAARALAPNITVIMLGTNDAKSGISDTCRNDLESDYLALIDDMQNVGADVLSAHPPEIYSNTYGISNTIFWNQVIPAIENAANSAGSNIIDCNTQFQGLGSGFPLLYRSATDGVHLNRDGRELLGDLVAKYIMERAYFLELVPACNCDGSCDGDEDHSSCPQDCTTTSSSSPTSTTSTITTTTTSTTTTTDIDLCANVVCSAMDQCHEAGTCDSSSGAADCSDPPKSDGTSCDDGNPSTSNDVCTAGVCAGSTTSTTVAATTTSSTTSTQGPTTSLATTSTTETCTMCGNGICETRFEDCFSCPADCNGKQKGKVANRYCCGQDVDCNDSRCSAQEKTCNQDVDISCGGGATSSTAAATTPPNSPPCGGNKATCSSNNDCCSNNCKNGGCKGNGRNLRARQA